MSGTKLKRTPVPTYHQLNTAEETSRNFLIGELESANSSSLSPSSVRCSIKKIKTAIKSYEAASRALSSWLSSHGSLSAASETRNTRLQLVHTDCSEAVKNLNVQLTTLGEDAMSSVAAPSIMADESEQPRNGNVLVDMNSQPVHDGPTQVIQAAAGSLHSVVDEQREASLPAFVDEQKSVERIPDGEGVDSNLPHPTVYEVPDDDSPKPASTKSHSENNEDVEILDPVSRRQLKQDLLKGYCEPFNGEPQYFWGWKQRISRRILEAEATALDSLEILQANTIGRPRKIITDSITSGGHAPQQTLARVWSSLTKRFGNNAIVSTALFEKLEKFPPIKSLREITQMEDLHDLCRIIHSNMGYCSDLKYLDLPRGMKTIWDKFPDQFRTGWRKQCYTLQKKSSGSPNLKLLLDFMEEFIDEASLPSFLAESQPSRSYPTRNIKAFSTKTEDNCIYHDASGHSVYDCKAFGKLNYFDKKQFVMKNKLCFACLKPHMIANCPRDVSCTVCKGAHVDVMHLDREQNRSHQRSNGRFIPRDVTTNCTEVCGTLHRTKVCSRIVPVELRFKNSSRTLKCLANIDEQSDSTFCDKKLLEYFGISSAPTQLYNLSTFFFSTSVPSSFAASSVKMEAMIIEGLKVKGIDEKLWIDLPVTITHPGIPQNKKGVASPELVASHDHIRCFAGRFPRIDPDLEILLLVGGNCGKAMETQPYGEHYPFVHKTPLGWAMVGPACRATSSVSKSVLCLKTNLEQVNSCEHFSAKPSFDSIRDLILKTDNYSSVFVENRDDNVLDLSRSDRRFLKLIGDYIRVNEEGKIEMPLPLKEDCALPENKFAVKARTASTLKSLKRDPKKLSRATETMGTYISRRHVEQIPPNELNTDMTKFYIPVFPVVSARKDKLRIVFDCSAAFQGRSLNDVLMQGPDEGNRIVGVLTRFRHGKIGFSGDLEMMFHCFSLYPEHRDLTRFFWWRNNDPEEQLVEFRSRVHNFGKKSSPAIANFGLRYTTQSDEAQKSPEAIKLIKSNFYVDDCLGSADTPEQAVAVLHAAIGILNRYSIRLHKLTSSDKDVTSSFPSTECSSDVDPVTLQFNEVQRTLGLSWCTVLDEFVLKCKFPDKPLTKRGVLSTLHSLYDPLGFVCPVTLTGRLIQRRMLSKTKMDNPSSALNWDEEIPPEISHAWLRWKSSLQDVEEIRLPRSFQRSSFGEIREREVHVFCDASDEAIGFVIYLRLIDIHDDINLSFVFANSKVAPKSAVSIPRLELCAALEGAQAAQYIMHELDVPLNQVIYYTDSCVVLGYLNNTERQFSRYVTGRVNTILGLSRPSQWKYVTSKDNPADIASRPQSPRDLTRSRWFPGPLFLLQIKEYSADNYNRQVDLPEIAKVVTVCSVSSDDLLLTDVICTRTTNLVKAICIVKAVRRTCVRWLQLIKRTPMVLEEHFDPLYFMVKQVQSRVFKDSLNTLSKSKCLSDSDPLSSLCPFEQGGILRVGGRLRHSQLDFQCKHPILLPRKGQLTIMILAHFHEKTFHQGRVITHSSLRQAGFHIHKGSQTIRSFLKSCITCKKLRGDFLTQQMADLPPDRLEEVSPFTSTGLDTFGPYLIHDSRSTRRTTATKKIWVLLLTCLNSRAIHLEPLSSLDAHSLDLAIRRFVAIRGECKSYRSDNGTNFIPVRERMLQQIPGLSWKLTPPGASHQAGIWERKVGSVKRVFSGALKTLGTRNLSREEFTTLLQESASIVNHTPLYGMSSDPNDPQAICPAMILNLRDKGSPTVDIKYSEADIAQYGRSRWRRVQYLSHQFWIKWRNNYIHTLGERHKWKSKKPCVAKDDVVLLREPNSQRNDWPMAVVTDVHRGRDGLVRDVTLRVPSKKAGGSLLRRCVADLILLHPAREHDCRS